MNDQKSIRILGVDIPLDHDVRNIFELRFLLDNPRVFSCTYGVQGFAEKSDEEQQNEIYRELLEEPSVQNLLPEIVRHGGLMEPILVRWDTKAVIEGNSRLAAFRHLYEKSAEEEKEKWETIPCEIISSLTDEQQWAFLNQLHVKGKTAWSAYEKANFAFVRHDKGGMTISEIADMFGETEQEISKRIGVITKMKKNHDAVLSHFSYYNVTVRTRKIADAISENEDLEKVLNKKIKALGEQSEEEAEFTAQQLRTQLPQIISKPKILKRFLKGLDSLGNCYQDAKESNALAVVKRALERLKGVDKKELEALSVTEINKLKPEARKLQRVAERVYKMVLEVKDQ